MLTKTNFVLMTLLTATLAACASGSSEVINPDEIVENTERGITFLEVITDSVVKVSEAFGEAVDKILD